MMMQDRMSFYANPHFAEAALYINHVTFTIRARAIIQAFATRLGSFSPEILNMANLAYSYSKPSQFHIEN